MTKKCWVCELVLTVDEFNDPDGHGYCSFCEGDGTGSQCLAIWNQAIGKTLQCLATELGPENVPALLREACEAVDESAGVSMTIKALKESLAMRIGALKRPG